MGSNLIKFALNLRTYAKRPYFMEQVHDVNSVVDLLEKHPVYQ
jgi:hypothetical protein